MILQPSYWTKKKSDNDILIVARIYTLSFNNISSFFYILSPICAHISDLMSNWTRLRHTRGPIIPKSKCMV